MIQKILWIFRAFLYKILFKKIKMISYIGKPIYLHNVKNVEIGKRVRIFPGLRIETHKKGNIIIGDNVAIGQNFHITSAGNLKIGKNTTILGNVFITNIDHDYRKINTHILDQRYIVKETEIGENCFIGYGVAIQAGTKLGKQCIVGANSVVRGEFSDYCVIAGVPAKIIKKYNSLTENWEKI